MQAIHYGIMKHNDSSLRHALMYALLYGSEKTPLATQLCIPDDFAGNENYLGAYDHAIRTKAEQFVPPELQCRPAFDDEDNYISLYEEFKLFPVKAKAEIGDLFQMVDVWEGIVCHAHSTLVNASDTTPSDPWICGYIESVLAILLVHCFEHVVPLTDYAQLSDGQDCLHGLRIFFPLSHILCRRGYRSPRNADEILQS